MALENDLENDLENRFVNDFVNGVENEVENAENPIFDAKNAEKTENLFLENAEEMDVENAEKMSDNYEHYQEELEDDFEEDLDEDEFDFPDDDFPDDDPLDDAIHGEPEEKPIDELLNDLTGESVKNLELLEELGELAMEKIDDSKALLCSAISGESPARYASDKKLNKALLKAFVNYLRSNHVKAPSPFGAFLLALAMWGLPTLGVAFWDRKQAKKVAQKQATQKATQSAESMKDVEMKGEAQSDSPQTTLDYTQLKEYQENRRLFDVHKETGCYNRTPKGQFCKTSLATEKPSPAIQRMLDEGWTNVEIRAALYNE